LAWPAAEDGAVGPPFFFWLCSAFGFFFSFEGRICPFAMTSLLLLAVDRATIPIF
jgi:hypothetical protein